MRERAHRYYRTRRGGVKKLFLLAGRGTKEQMQREAKSMRKRWRYVRVVPANKFDQKAMRDLMDDWMVYVFEKLP